MTRMVDADDLATAVTIAVACDVSTKTVYAWAERDDFPTPVLTLGLETRVWLLSEVNAWCASRPVREPVGHGTVTRYHGGCRCRECRAAQAANMRDYRLSRRVPSRPSPARLTASGVSTPATSNLCRLSPPVGADEEVG